MILFFVKTLEVAVVLNKGGFSASLVQYMVKLPDQPFALSARRSFFRIFPVAVMGRDSLR